MYGSQSGGDGLQWQMVLTLGTLWSIIFLRLYAGVSSAGVVTYATGAFRYIMLTAMLVRGLTLEGAMKGVKFYAQFDLKKLATFQVEPFAE